MNWITALSIAVIAVAVGAYLFLGTPGAEDPPPEAAAPQDAPAITPTD
ncbi:MAG: hypothetical protein AAGG09_11105 [Pseudomonadota bacterium]